MKILSVIQNHIGKVEPECLLLLTVLHQAVLSKLPLKEGKKQEQDG